MRKVMYRVLREIQFNYGHRLLNYEGKCAHLHGHNARVRIEVASLRLNPQGMVMDFYEIREKIGNWIDKTLDHKVILCEKDPLVKLLQGAGEPVLVLKENPTAEVLAKWIFGEAAGQGLPVSRVALWETDKNCAVYSDSEK